MTVQQRILSLKYLENQKHHLNFANRLGVEVNVKKTSMKNCRKNKCISEGEKR